MHTAVLTIVAKPLEDSLNYVQRQQPLRSDISPLIEALKPSTQRQRRETSFYSELENWATAPGGGLLAALRHTIEPLIPWAAAFSASADSTPPHYTHRQLVETLKILGAKAVLQLFLDELMTHFDNGGLSDLDVVLDIIVTMITVPQHHLLATIASNNNITLHNPQQQRQLSLQEALHTEFLHAFELSKTNLPRATLVVRLYRRVEAYLSRASTDANTVDVGGETDVLLQSVVVRNAEGIPTADIDEVLQNVEADTQDFLAGANANFLAGVR
jgi:mediator of RNA polymerase II transcription subunit 5